ncbi:hypothetical protein GCM10010151_14820 [Actinoallomurus spadix]|uniref:Uncharacterized protein n=2 Tax=Actinoallomurus spadix TaxID=79912 RepID=A0ABP3FXK0_9ACTN
MDVGMHVQLGRVTDGVHELYHELANLCRREVTDPGKHLRKGEEDGTSALIAADECGEQPRGDVCGLFALPVVPFGGEVQVLAIPSSDMDALSTFDGLGDPLGVLRQLGE